MGIRDKFKSVTGENSGAGRMLGTGRRKAAAAGITAAVIVALAATVVLNMGKGGNYVALFPGISKEENSEILTVLNARGVEARRNSEGEVTVPEDQLGDIMLDMSELGYPKTALPFDIFSDNMGFTTTEFEKRQYLLMNLQDRIERTLKDMTGIKNAIVTLNVPDESHYVWNEDQPSSTGSVSLTLMPSYELSPEKVSAIKNLVSDSVPRLAPENVTVVNAQTMQEMVSDVIGTTAYGLNRLDFETKVEERLENKIKNVLTLAYAPDKLRVSATVVIDYDRMITEDMHYEPQENGQGVVDRYKEGRNLEGGASGAGGIAGEENNTDIPSYGTAGTGAAGGTSGDYYRDVDYLVSYIKKQIEKDNVKLQKATVAITVNDDNLTEAKKQQLVDAASKAANIAPEDIVVSSFREMPKETVPAPKPALPVQAPAQTGLDYRTIAAAAGVGVLLFLLILLLLMSRRKKKHMREDQELFAHFEDEGGEAAGADSAEQRAAEDAVQTSLGKHMEDLSSPVDQVRSFAQMNPEIIASMISSWLKEDKK